MKCWKVFCSNSPTIRVQSKQDPGGNVGAFDRSPRRKVPSTNVAIPARRPRRLWSNDEVRQIAVVVYTSVADVR